MKIAENKFIALSYDLNVGDEELELMERATPDTPLEFIYGTGSMLEAFEKNIADLKQGDNFSFVLQPEEAYGAFSEEHILDLPRNMFEEDGVLNEEVVYQGNVLPMMDQEGNKLNGTVVEVKDDIIVMDFNHPLAGEVLNFSGKVLVVRDATPEELTALFSAPSCGCGCGDGDDEDSACGSGGCDSGGCGCGC